MASMSSSPAVSSGDLTDLISSTGSTTIYPNDDAVLNVLQTRFRADLPYSHIGASNLVVVNPLKTLANLNEASAKDYEERCFKDTSVPTAGSPKAPQPHLYGLAAKVYLLMRQRKQSQAVVFRGITGSGKTESSKLLVNQILRLSARSKKEQKVAEQLKSLSTLLDSFGNAKTLLNPNASRHGRYLELHFNEHRRIGSAKVLTYGLDKTRLTRLTHEERTYHVFYQLLAGSTTEERDRLNMEDPSDYALLASSGCYRLPGGPFSDDATAMTELRAAMRTLGFKTKHVTAIFNLLIAILLLGNLEFVEGVSREDTAHVVNTLVLDQAARLLGVTSEDLAQALTNRTSYVRKELYTVLLSPEQSAMQRDQLVRDLYSILFAFVVETANHKLAPNPADPAPPTQIVLLDQAGFQSRSPSGTNSIALTANAPLIAAYGQNGFEEFCINFADELVHSYIVRNTFEDAVGYNAHLTGDGITLPPIETMDNSACVELLRGAQLSERAHRKPGGMLGIMNKACSSYKQGKGGDRRDEDMLQDMMTKFGVHASYVASPALGGSADSNLFGINHYAGPCSYDVTHFIEKDTDLLDAGFVTLLRNSTDSFVSKLVSGPSLATETHHQDSSIVVQAQVSSRPLRHPTAITGSSTSQQDEPNQLDPSKTYPITTQLNHTLSELFFALDRAHLWTVSCIRPNDSGSPNSFDKRRVKAQVRSLLLPDLISRRRADYVVDFEQEEFCDRYVPTMLGETPLRIRQCVQKNGLKEGTDYVLGHRCIWLTYDAWKLVDDGVREQEKASQGAGGVLEDESVGDDAATEHTQDPSPFSGAADYYSESADNLLLSRTASGGMNYLDPNNGATSRYAAGGLKSPVVEATPAYTEPDDGSAWGSEWDKKGGGDRSPPQPNLPKEAGGLTVHNAPNTIEEVPTSRSRRFWLIIVMLCTWWIPDFLLKHVGRMKRPDVRLAWREKLTICILIAFTCGLILFYIIIFGRLLCPNFDKAWNLDEVSQHSGTNDFFVAIQGRVYDVTNFVGHDHSDITGSPSNSQSILELLGGADMTNYFPPPLALACSGVVTGATASTLTLQYANFTPVSPTAIHTSGALAVSTTSALSNDDWYTQTFLPKINQFHKGPVVWDKGTVKSQAQNETAKTWAFYKDKLYDLTDYLNTLTVFNNAAQYKFLDEDIVDAFKEGAGGDITKSLDQVLATKDTNTVNANMDCIQNMFFVGQSDFRKTARCRVQNILLLVASIILIVTIAAKFLAALQLGSKRHPELQDKFVICQVPCYTESEDSLRRTIDSLAALKYDDKRKLIFVICDGNIIGSGNDRPTPRIVLDLLGVDPKLDPEPLLFKSVGEGSRQLNYGKVYSGLYEFEGHVVPYIVVVKVGKPTERSKPGNRGKRDSQILVMHYLNRVHFDAPMNPLELEIYHQMRNVIGIDPAFYEYLFTVDADTSVTPDSLNRLVACAADDSSIIGICGETKLDNEEGSWWTMIQVYEYYISHHLAKAFESLFGSVTCLPGCFSLYRIRTADKGRPIIISNRIIDEYAEGNVDTLHKKNLFSLGEDRFLTTLLIKHFPTFRLKFTPDALAHTVAPESWSVLLSQRRRWINSTVHNLCELVFLPELCGICCFSMRFIVFIDLLGTIILPATVIYLVYLIVTVATGAGAIPTISLIMIAAVYGLQALIFIIKREFMLVGWMIVYLLSYPVYSFFLPIYSFWCMDDFSWGNTRLVVGEGNNKKVIMAEDEKFDDSMIPLKKFSEYEAEAWEHEDSHRSDDTRHTGYDSGNHSRQNPSSSRPGSIRSYHQASQSGDYYRDTNLTYNNSSNPNLRLPNKPSLSNLSHHTGRASMSQPAPQLGPMPFAAPFGTAGSVMGGGSDFGATGNFMGQMNTGPSFGAPASMYGMPMMPSGTGSQIGGFGGAPGMGMGMGGPMMGGMGQQMQPPQQPIGMQRPMSTFSLATTMNPFASGPNMNENPSDEELLIALRAYLSTQDLMSVTKKTARDAIAAKFPRADLSSRKDFLNQSIDQILSES
ncbi:chitin synthase [Fomitiporia mediterranea MF3/22]|uniref:chitin synthase n=1 Tax=Fomitiporia mediterranea (strain MF3/22) TaxID=694068 RepID=UPI0004407602|nr:chitin synthase [Fomitiporia mediterranea MF3/22]EJD01749.1 chitin synthase [Fomitiporia mediterranea MF3/22]